MNSSLVNTLGILALAILLLIKDAVIPMIKKTSNRRNNPINVDRLYQEFKDFKEAQEKWNEKMEKRIEKVEEKR